MYVTSQVLMYLFIFNNVKFISCTLQMVRNLVNNGANLIWEHSLSDPGQMKSGIRKPNPKDAVQ